MITMFGFTTAFAHNNHNEKHDRTVEVKNHVHGYVDAVMAGINAPHNDFMKEYEKAKRCTCKNCRKFVKAVEKQRKNNYKNECRCPYCTDLLNVREDKPVPGRRTIGNHHRMPAGGRR